MKIGLVLEGGGMRGMYTSGVLDVLFDNYIDFDIAIGVSAGALFGVNYFSKQRGRALRYSKIYAKDPRYMGIKSLITTGNIINKEFAFYQVPYKLDIFDDETYKSSSTDFYAVTTELETGEPYYHRLDSIFEQMDYLRASGSLPYVSKPVVLDGKMHLDGGMSDAIPALKALEMGCDKVIVILTRPSGYQKKEASVFSKILNKVFYGKYSKFSSLLDNNGPLYNEKLKEIQKLESEGKILVIRPSQPITISRLESNQDRLQEVYDLGVEDGKNMMININEYLK